MEPRKGPWDETREEGDGSLTSDYNSGATTPDRQKSWTRGASGSFGDPRQQGALPKR